MDEIEVIGDMDTAEVKRTNWDFVVGDNAASKIGDLFWFGLFKPSPSSFQTPMVNAFIMGSLSTTTTSGIRSRDERSSMTGSKIRSGASSSSYGNPSRAPQRRVSSRYPLSAAALKADITASPMGPAPAGRPSSSVTGVSSLA